MARTKQTARTLVLFFLHISGKVRGWVPRIGVYATTRVIGDETEIILEPPKKKLKSEQSSTLIAFNDIQIITHGKTVTHCHSILNTMLRSCVTARKSYFDILLPVFNGHEKWFTSEIVYSGIEHVSETKAEFSQLPTSYMNAIADYYEHIFIEYEKVHWMLHNRQKSYFSCGELVDESRFRQKGCQRQDITQWIGLEANQKLQLLKVEDPALVVFCVTIQIGDFCMVFSIDESKTHDLWVKTFLHDVNIRTSHVAPELASDPNPEQLLTFIFQMTRRFLEE